MGVVLFRFNIRRPRRLIELSNVTQMASRTLAENSRYYKLSSLGGSVGLPFQRCLQRAVVAEVPAETIPDRRWPQFSLI
jgi:hypothetical protein